MSGVPQKYLKYLELRDVILELAEDLYDDCPLHGGSDPQNPRAARWYEKYSAVTYRK